MFKSIFSKLLLGLITYSFFLISSTFAATVFSPGDIQFITINSNPDYFEVVSRVNIDTGAIIHFSDNAWNGSAWKTPISEGNITFTSSTSIASGTIIKFSGTDTASPSITPSGIGSVSKNGSFDLSTAGEQILAYQGSIIYDPSANFLYGFGFGSGVSWISSGIPTSNTSYLPSSLVIGTSASSSSFRNIQYNCQNVGILSSTFISDINNSSYWTGKNTSVGYLPSSCIFDAIAPLSNINLASGQQIITSGMTVKYVITFSEAINTTTFDCSDITFSGSASGKTCTSINQINPNDGTTFEIITNVSSDGTISTNIQTGSITDISGNPHIINNIINNTVTISTTLPVVTLSGNSSVTISQNSIYNDSGASWTDLIDGSGFIAIATSGTINTTILGTYVLEYSYTNSIGNKGSIIRTIIVNDQTPPTISTGSVSINEGNSITINAASLTTDTNAISGYDFDIDNNGTNDFSNTSGILTLTWNQLQIFGITGNNTTLLPSDMYMIRLGAKDNSNNTGSGFFQLKVYNITPIVNILEPIISGKIYTGTLPIQWSITDPADQDFPMNTDLFFSTNGTTYNSLATTTSNRTGSLGRDTTTVPDKNNYTIRIRAIDDYGNNTITSLPFKIDNNGPSISGQLSYTIAEGNNIIFSLTGTTDAVAGISGFIRTINSTTISTTTGILSLSRAQLQSGGVNNDGSYTIGVQAIDNVGNISTKNITLIVTNTAPSLSIISPASSIYSGNLTINRVASDPASADLPLNMIISYNNGINSGIILQGTNLTNPYNRNLASIPDGTGYRITISASDDDITTTITGNMFSIDHTSPTINGFSGTYIINEGSGLIIDLHTSTDAIAGLSGGSTNFVGSINGISLPANLNGYRNLSRAQLASYGITNGSGQSYPLHVQITDAIGNSKNTTGILTVLNIKPSIAITNPIPSPNVVGTIPVQRVTNDPVDTPLQINIYYGSTSNGPRTLLGSGLSSIFTGLSWNTTSVGDGVYYIKATATDDKDITTTLQGPITINNIPDFVGGGGGGGSSISSDYCPNGDYSTSKYDGICGNPPASGNTQTTSGTNGTNLNSGTNVKVFEGNELFNTDIENGYCYTRIGSGTIINSNYANTSEEFQKSVAFLYSYKMTMYNNIDNFGPYSNLTREQAAKIFSNFAVNVLCRKPNTSLNTSYTDIQNSNESLKPYITTAYQLGLMKGGKNGEFRPFDTITKAEFNAVLVRMILKGYLNEDSDIWYTNYNTVANKLGIIKQGANGLPVPRHDAALMMFRAYKNQKFALQDIDYTSYVLNNRETFIK